MKGLVGSTVFHLFHCLQGSIKVSQLEQSAIAL